MRFPCGAVGRTRASARRERKFGAPPVYRASHPSHELPRRAAGPRRARRRRRRFPRFRCRAVVQRPRIKIRPQADMILFGIIRYRLIAKSKIVPRWLVLLVKTIIYLFFRQSSNFKVVYNLYVRNTKSTDLSRTILGIVQYNEFYFFHPSDRRIIII